MKLAVIIGIVIAIIGIGVLYYSMSMGENDSEVIVNVPNIDETEITEGRNLSINLKESVGIEATPWMSKIGQKGIGKNRKLPVVLISSE